jgi:hypothetical protein
MNGIIRVFPRRTAATPDDDWAFVGPPPLPGMRPPAQDVRAIHVSTAFTWDKPAAFRLLVDWTHTYGHVPGNMGGPAFDEPGGEFTPGLYLRKGYVITSRGCVRRCPWCLAAQREGGIRELSIRAGHDVLDNNLLACSRGHIRAVLDMLADQPEPARFTGGLDARLLLTMPDVATRIARGRLDVAYLAYDSPAAWAPVERAIKMLLDAGGWRDGQGRRKIGVYVLAGFDPLDTESAIVERAGQVVAAGATPFLMVYRPPTSQKDARLEGLKRSLRRWMRPTSIFAAHEVL